MDAVSSGIAAMGQLAGPAAYAVVLADLQMPVVDGLTLLRRARDLQPDASRVILTGHGDLGAAVRGINEGALDAFLLKPCTRERLGEALDAAVRAHDRRRCEREVLSATISGAVRALVDLLAMAHPRAFARSQRIRQEALALAAAAGIDGGWELDVGATLSQIASVLLPDSLLDQLDRGQDLSAADRVLYDSVPQRGAAMLDQIPRLGPVAEALRHQLTGFDGIGPPGDGRSGHDLPIGSRILRLAIDIDTLRSRDAADAEIVALLRQRPGDHDPDLLDAFARTAGTSAVVEVMVGDLAPGAQVACDVRDPSGELLVGRDVVLSERSLALLRGRFGPALRDARILVRLSPTAA